MVEALRSWRTTVERQVRAELLEERVDDAVATLGALEEELRAEAADRIADIEAATEALLLAELDDTEPADDPGRDSAWGGEVIELPRRPDEH